MHPAQSRPSFPKTPAPAAPQEGLPPHKPPTLPLDQVITMKYQSSSSSSRRQEVRTCVCCCRCRDCPRKGHCVLRAAGEGAAQALQLPGPRKQPPSRAGEAPFPCSCGASCLGVIYAPFSQTGCQHFLDTIPRLFYPPHLLHLGEAGPRCWAPCPELPVPALSPLPRPGLPGGRGPRPLPG